MPRGRGSITGAAQLAQEVPLSREGMERIVEKALSDESFRVALFTDPRGACEPFQITEEEFLVLMGQALPRAGQAESQSARL